MRYSWCVYCRRIRSKKASRMQYLKVSKSCVVQHAVPARPVTKGARCVPLIARAEADGAPLPVEKTGPNFAPAKDIDAIMKALPHR